MNHNDAQNHKKKWEELQREAEAAETTEPLEGLPPLETKTPEEIIALENAVDAARNEAEAKKNDYLRILAEMENLKRRCEKDVENAARYSVGKIIRELLPVIDSLEKTLEHADNDNLRQGAQMTLDLFLNILKKFHVTVVDPLNQPFNPEQQEAISAVPNNAVAPNTVLQVLQKGYVLYDRLLRPALVIVSQQG